MRWFMLPAAPSSFNFCYFSFQRKINFIFQFYQIFCFIRFFLPEFRFRIENFTRFIDFAEEKIILKSSEAFNSIWI